MPIQKSFKINKNILIALGTNMIFVLLAVFVFGTEYATDDDIAMARIAYGLFFEPQSRLVFTCTAFGGMLKGLSLLFGGINWQLIVYYLSLFYGGVVSLYYVLNKKEKILTNLWMLVVAGFYYSTYVSINFSVITSMLAFFGYITLFIGVEDEEKMPIALSSLTLIFSMIIRYESFLAFSFFAVVSFVLIFLKNLKSTGLKTVVKKYIVPFALALALPICLLIVDRLSYKNEEWINYLEYNDNRSQILDFQSVLQHEDESYFVELGLTDEMVNSLKNWQFNDTEVFSEQLIIKMGEDSKKYNPKFTMDFIFSALGYSVERICKNYYFAFAILMLIFLTTKTDKEKHGEIKVFAAPWILILPLVVEIGFYYFMNRGIDRVFRTTGLGLWCGIFVLLSCGYFEDYKKLENLSSKWMSKVIVILAILCLSLQVDDLKEMRGFHLIDKKEIEKEYSFLQDGRIYMCDIESIRILEEACGNWQVPSSGSLYNCIELGGWMVNYPCAKEKQIILGVSNPYKALAYNDNAYLLTTEDGEIQLEFLKSAYDKNIESELIEQHGELSVYKYSIK